MKTLVKIISFAFVLTGINSNLFAQLTLNATASATIVQTLTFSKLFDLDFGNLASNGQPGTCELTPMAGNNPTRTPGGGITLPAFHGTPRAAAFTVTGVPGVYITITVNNNSASPLTITRISGTETMTVDSYTTDQGAGSGPWTMQLDAISGSATFYVGATVHSVVVGQVAGVYTNTTGFPVMVNYQ
jgi:hypothetical protein